MKIKPNQIWQSKFYGDSVRAIIHSVYPTEDRICAYIVDLEHPEGSENLKNLILESFQTYYELVEE
jgi:hypothetical protein